MSNERVFGLYKQLLRLAEDQLNALHEERFDEALEYLEKRQRIIDEIQRLDATGRNDHQREDVSHQIRGNIERIYSIDTELRNFIQTELNAISHRLEDVQKTKTFFRNMTFNQEGNTLNISA